MSTGGSPGFDGFHGFDGGLVVVTDRAQAAERGRALPDVVGAAVDGGARTVLLREKDLPRDERRALAEVLAGLLRPVGGLLLVASDVGLARDVGAGGVHLAAADPWPPRDLGGPATTGHPAHTADRRAGDDGRGAAAGPMVVGRSCHSVDDLRQALTNGADYVSLSPIWPSPSKPGYGPALGPSGLAAACVAVPALAVVALGGVAPGRAAACRAAGAAAVAVMGDVMRADDAAGCVRSLLAELDGAKSTRA